MPSIDDLSDAELIAAVASVVRTPRTDPADSFVLHAPLELAARAALLPRVAPGERSAARAQIAAVATAFEAFGPATPPHARMHVRFARCRRDPSCRFDRGRRSRRRRRGRRVARPPRGGVAIWHPSWPTRSSRASLRRHTARSSCSRCHESRHGASSPESSSVRSRVRWHGTRSGACGGSTTATAQRLALRTRSSPRFKRHHSSASRAATSSTR